MRRDPGELPAEVTGFVGRQRELAVLDGLLGTARLVTVTGPGGVGKTRVALRRGHLAIERCDQGLHRLGAGCGRHQERWARGYLQTITAMALFFQNKYTESAAAACGSLERKHELGDIVGTAYCLEALGMLAARQQRCERTAWLMGAADVLWDRAGHRRTVDAHLEHIFGKLGITSRVQLATTQLSQAATSPERPPPRPGPPAPSPGGPSTRTARRWR